MPETQSVISDDEGSMMEQEEEDEDLVEPVKAPGVFHAPTTQELVKLREGSELFKSNSFKLQASRPALVIHCAYLTSSTIARATVARGLCK